MKRLITLSLAVFLLFGCSSYRPLNPDRPDGYFEFWCDPKNVNGLAYSDGHGPKESYYYEFHSDSRYKSKEECLENHYYGTSGSAAVKRKQLDDRLDEQVKEKQERDESK